MRRLTPVTILIVTCMLAMPLYALEADVSLEGVRTFMRQGNYDLAIDTARLMLKQSGISDSERLYLLQAVADAEGERAALRNYEQVDTAVRAYEDLMKEFPERINRAEMLWQIARLYWHHQNLDRADTAVQLLLKQHPHAAVARKAALLHARIMIKKGKHAKARGILLAYYGLGASVSAEEEAEGLAWLAIIDYAEGKNERAFATLSKAYQQFPTIIENEAMLYATFITLLSEQGEAQATLMHARRFLARHVPSLEAPRIQLVQADVLARLQQWQKAADIYGILADRYGHLSVGKKARIRQLVIEHRDTHAAEDLKAVIASLAALAAGAQLSDIEAEAQLDQARLLMRLEQQEPGQADKAIGLYALVAASEHGQFALPARLEGRQLVRMRIEALLADKEWLEAVVLWKRYPQLQPANSDELAFGIAQAYTHLLDFDRAEEILDQLYAKAKGTVRGQRIMLQKARLWLERGDADGVDKIMHWLTGHEYTLYRQDMLLMVAEMQAGQGDHAAARQTLASVTPTDLAPELRREYWLAHAKVSLGLKRWHAAASAWHQLVELSSEDERSDHLKAEAEALIASTDYAAAEQVLRSVPEGKRDDRWQFAMAMCARHTGRHKQAQDYLQALAAAKPETGYSTRARLVLAEQKAEQLVQAQR